MGCVARPSRSSSSASSSNPEYGTPSRRRSPTTPPWFEDWAEAVQLPRSSVSSNARYNYLVEQHAAYWRGESPSDAASRKDSVSATGDDLSDCQACRAPPRYRSPRTPRMCRAVEAQTWSCATAASSSSNHDPSDPHRTEGLQRRRLRSSRRPIQPPGPEETSLDGWFEAQVALRLVTLSSSK